MKYLFGVVTFAATEIQITKMALREPVYTSLVNPPVISGFKKILTKLTLNDAETLRSVFHVATTGVLFCALAHAYFKNSRAL